MYKQEIKNLDLLETIHCDSDEQETTVNFLRKQNTINIFTSDNTTLTKLKKCVLKNPDEWRIFEGSRDANGYITGYFFEAPKKAITFKPGITKKSNRVFSDEQREAIRNRFKKNKQ